jgi:hypothetical protein
MKSNRGSAVGGESSFASQPSDNGKKENPHGSPNENIIALYYP